MMETDPPQKPTSQDSLSVRIVEKVAAHEGIDPVDVSPPLHTVIDTDALDSLFDPTTFGRSRTGRVTFDYRGHTVVVVEKNEHVEIGIEGQPEQDNSDEILP